MLSTIDLLELTSLDQLLLTLQILFTFLKKATLTRRAIVPSHPLQLVFPARGLKWDFNAVLRRPLSLVLSKNLNRRLSNDA
jgi:hypothetical protein